MLTPDRLHRVQEYLGGIVRSLESKLLAAGGAADHVNLAISLHASHAVAEALRLIKCNSTNWVRETFPPLADFAWQDGYAAFTVSTSVLPSVEKYLATQAAHHAKQSFVDELKALLRKHGIEFDESRFV